MTSGGKKRRADEMASSYSFPEIPISTIAAVLAESGIATVSVEELAAPTPNLVRDLYSSVLDYFQLSPDDINEQLDFDALQLLDNPENHEGIISVLNIYYRMKEFLVSISYNGFMLSDLLSPKPPRMILIFSAIVNFIYYREERLTKIQDALDKVPACEERKNELVERHAELNKQKMDYEVARKIEEPMVHEVEAEVNKIKQLIPDYNKLQVQMRNQALELMEKTDAIDVKISQADFELLKKSEENSKLHLQVVSPPEKLKSTLEEKRKQLAELNNSERVSIQNVQEKNTVLEMYIKAYEKMSKLLSQIHATKELIISAKVVEKDVKALKVKLSADEVSAMSTESKLIELQGKVKLAEESLRAAENEKNARLAENSVKLNNVRAEVDLALKCLEIRENKLEDMMARSDSLRVEADSIREAEKLDQQKLLAKFEEILFECRSYSNRASSFLQDLEAEVKWANPESDYSTGSIDWRCET